MKTQPIVKSLDPGMVVWFAFLFVQNKYLV